MNREHLEAQILRYYGSRESRIGYRTVLQGRRHFGFYEDKTWRGSLRGALERMEHELGDQLGLRPGETALDAGCGEGLVALYLIQNFQINVDGIDILPVSIEGARRNAVKAGESARSHFEIASYLDVPASSGRYDGVYTMETLVHSTDLMHALREFFRVLRSYGRLVLFEYSIPDLMTLSHRERGIFREIIERTGMYSLPSFIHGRFPEILGNAGFVDIEVTDITAHVEPMAKFFHDLGFGPYILVRLLGLERYFVNTMSGVELYRLGHLIRYNIVSARKP